MSGDPIFTLAMVTLGIVLAITSLQAYGARKALQESRSASSAARRRGTPGRRSR